MSALERYILVVSHATQQATLEAAVEVCQQIQAQGAVPVIRELELSAVLELAPELTSLQVLEKQVPVSDIECAIVVGGDGTILRAAELLRGTSVPMLGVNTGHVGFLAETERDSITDTVSRVLAQDFVVEERSTLSVRVKVGNEVVFETWALNEATVEKASRERMLEVVIEVDRRPLSSFGCDGVVMSTPTGSTAYSFSAGGPIVWPSVDAMILVPLSAHALFARPLVVGPESVLAVEILERRSGHGVLWCDGRRTRNLPPGARVVVKKSPVPVLLARMHDETFTDRLVEKFDLPVTGWRGPGA
ncbi:NAD kinase [Aurantimicrobium sp. MWH-Uga1]|uniref:NAD kinase n=1 Tax=Aurantimicrobium sp. MWH-Uga1 TaxID=2079575 RepID=UPI000DEE0B30|nr:NAD kinase [Aurantimicrobium sp. MWH-Uga1]AXE54376.1 Inorganic polyphosphate/ATP-NAD kinase [Aurantimicrobium sp. MWH-Uga1]